jgi:Protein of unknown function (DUF1566)
MRTDWKSRWGWRVSAVVLAGGLLALGAGTAVTQAGERDDEHHRGGQGGNHTLRWDTNHPSASRFTTAFHGAVLDKNTGLVWEQAPDATVFATRSDAAVACVNRNVGGTRGWRLPSVVELTSLIDPSLPPPFVPASIFTIVSPTPSSPLFWSATSGVEITGSVWIVDLQFGRADAVNGAAPVLAWCVRGGMNADAY